MPFSEMPLSEMEVAALFHENTKITPYENGDEPAWLPAPLPPGIVQARFRLPPIRSTSAAAVEQVIHRRVTTRVFAPHVPLARELLSRLLAFSCGYTTPDAALPPPGWHRAAPSAGATYPIEVYPVVLRVADLPAGVYHYAANDHSLELLRPGHFGRALAAWTLHQPYMADTSVIFVLAGMTERVSPRYGERGYRYLFLEAGHIAQNLCLLATAYGLGALPNGGFVDEAVNRLLVLNGTTELALYLVAVGVPQARR